MCWAVPSRFDGQAYTLIGVAAPEFLGVLLESSPDLWISSARLHAGRPLQMIARLKPGVSASQAQAALEVLFNQLAGAQPGIVPGGRRDEPPAHVMLLARGKGSPPCVPNMSGRCWPLRDWSLSYC